MDFHFTSDGKLTKDRRKGKRTPKQVNQTKKAMEEQEATTLPKSNLSAGLHVIDKRDPRRE